MADGGGKWETVKTTGKKYHPRKDPEKKKAVRDQERREEERLASGPQHHVSDAVVAALAASRNNKGKGPVAPNENGTFSVAVDRTKMPKSVSKSVAAEELAKSKHKTKHGKKPKRKAAGVGGAAGVVSAESADVKRLLETLTGEALQKEFAAIVADNPDVASWPMHVAELAVKTLQGAASLPSLSEPLALLSENARTALISFFRDRIPTNGRAWFIGTQFEQGERAAGQLMLQAAAAAWPDQTMAELEAVSPGSFTPLHSLILGSALSNQKLAARGATVWLRQFVEGVNSHEHFLALERTKRFADKNLCVAAARRLAAEADEATFGAVATRLLLHPDVFSALLPTAAYAETQTDALPVLLLALLTEPAGCFARWKAAAADNVPQTANLLLYWSRNCEIASLRQVRGHAEPFFAFVASAPHALPESKRAAAVLLDRLNAKSWLATLGAAAGLAVAAGIAYLYVTGKF